MAAPQHGEIWTATLDPIEGHEQGGTRPVLIVSTTLFNQGKANLVVVVPLTRTDRKIPTHVAVNPPEGGLRYPSFIMCEGMRSIATQRLGAQTWGQVRAGTLRAVKRRLQILMDL